MKLYHAGFEIIKNPDVHYGRKNADFGQGFYVTDREEFARRWAKERRDMRPVINTYEMNFDGLKVHRFKRDHEWFTYIFGNRRGKQDGLDADVIIGPIANDTIYDTLGMITSGILSDEEALSLLQIGPEYYQIVLKSEKAAANLQWLEARKLRDDEIGGYREILQKEQQEYLETISKKMQEF
ncbi:MAG: DUF3990 domain-containing protein [Acetatifactor sp.]|nr:DUF3990 domain-containing protein [Acetatifactor sp.]